VCKLGANESLTVDTTDLSEDFTLNGLLQLLAERYFPNADYIFKEGSGFLLGSIVARNSTFGTVTITDDNILLSSLTASSGGISLQSIFTTNLTPYLGKTLYIELMTDKSLVQFFGANASSGANSFSTNHDVIVTPDKAVTVEIPISTIIDTSHPYCMFGFSGNETINGSITIYNVYVK